jgi:hypothetical protein
MAEDSRPVPDPTVLTTEALRRDMNAMRETIDARREGAKDERGLLTMVRAEVDKEVEHLRKLHDNIASERNKSFELQIKERDVRAEKTAASDKSALDAALQAAEKAVGKQNEAFSEATKKSEEAFTKQLDGLAKNIQTEIVGLKDTMNKMVAELSIAQGRSLGHQGHAQDSKANVGMWAGVAMVVIGFLGLFAGAAAFLMSLKTAVAP